MNWCPSTREHANLSIKARALEMECGSKLPPLGCGYLQGALRASLL